MAGIRGTPFVPGRAAGVLRRGGGGQVSGAVRLLTQREAGSADASAAALIVVDAAPLSHPLIRALGLGLPTVLVSEAQARLLEEGAVVAVDGSSGEIVPGQATALGVESAAGGGRPGGAVFTRDGQRLELRVSVATPAAAARGLANGASAVGVVRTEYLFPADGRVPDAAFFEGALRRIAAAAHPLPLTVRLLDIAADKCPPWVRLALRGPLGLRGPRLYGMEPVAAAVRAAVEAIGALAGELDLRILVPYVTRVEEFLAVRRLIEGWLPRPMAVGAMLETPAALLAMREWVQLADFVAVGTNDLLQNLFAADRDVPEVAHLLDPYSPVPFRLLRQAAGDAGDEVAGVQLCGLLPQLPGSLQVLLGLGYRTFSVEPLLLPYHAEAASGCDTFRAEGLAAGVCAESDADAVRAVLGLPPGRRWSLGRLAQTAAQGQK